MTRPTANLRLFVAAYPPEAVVEAFGAAVARLDLPAHRLVPPDQVHLTLLFIGDRPVAAMDDVIESVTRAASGLPAFELRPETIVAMPARGPRRLVAARTDAPPMLLELQRRLAARLARPQPAGRRRSYVPHCTLLRFRSPWSAGGDLTASLEDAPVFPVDAIRLMRSTLHPDGARHQDVMRIALDG